MKTYKVSDDRSYINEVQAIMFMRYGAQVWRTLINGFCMVSTTDKWWSGAYSKEAVFNPKHKMTKNEDELQGRWMKLGRVIAVSPGSFVWHYRGVTRNSTKGAQGKGWFRIKKEK
jgi:hypothetical protein